MTAPVALFLSGVFACAADLAPEVLLLQRARVVMSRNLSRLPNYTCLQTIERFERLAPNKKPRLVDIVRLEVALVDGKELFAWPGSGQFSDQKIADMVQGGAIGNGGFALHAKAVFQSTVPRFIYGGQISREARSLHKWEYVVAQMLSGYVIKVGQAQATVGYHGSFFVDATTLDLISLEVEADDIPPFLRLRSASMSVAYDRVDIGGETFLLPSRWDMDMVGLDGSISSNRTHFTKCRQYSGESKLFFDDPEPAESRATGLVRVVDAPPKIVIPIELETPVRFENAAVGDPVTAKLTKSVKLPDGTVLPKGALVHGRLKLLREQVYIRDRGTAVGMTFFEAEAPGVRVRFSATLEEIQTAQPGFRTQSAFGPIRPENETLTGSVFFVHSRILQIPRGLRMMWRTKTPAAEDAQ
jgi:hypothetical protein